MLTRGPTTVRSPGATRGWALAALLLVAAACGGDEPGTPVERGGGGGAEPEKKKVEEGPPQLEPIPNPQWDKIKGFFHGTNDPSTGFVRTPVQGIRDPFEVQVRKYVERIEFKPTDYGDAPKDLEPKAEEGADDGGENVTTIDQTPPCETCKFRAQDYRLLLIRWGSAVNKAVVLDPEGESYVIAKDMPFGNNQGRVAEITRYEVYVAEDTQEEPIVLSIRPDLLKQAADENTSDRLFLQQGGAR